MLGETKFTAKKYFDIVLTHEPRMEEEQIVPIIISCLRTAVKVFFYLLSNANPKRLVNFTLFSMLLINVGSKFFLHSFWKWN